MKVGVVVIMGDHSRDTTASVSLSEVRDREGRGSTGGISQTKKRTYSRPRREHIPRSENWKSERAQQVVGAEAVQP